MLGRTYFCGEVPKNAIGEKVTLKGWVQRRRDLGGLIFIHLRDRTGIVQIVFNPEVSQEALEVAEKVRSEYVVEIEGTVIARDESTFNSNLSTGTIEVQANRMTIINESKTPPFMIEDQADVSEDVRLKYRYLDLRRPVMFETLKMRHQVTKVMRDFLDSEGFLDIETPILTKSTPEGARDYLVPSRVHPGEFYALPQSPQLFKQLLMVGGVERYYQIARCYRDEDFRADRQPEFTQLDVEMSFADQDDVIAIGEKVVAALWALIGVDVPLPIPRMTYTDSMRRYGNDKPDLRFDLELVECTDYFADTEFRVFQAPYVGAVVMPGGASQPRKQLDAWQEFAKQRGARGLAYVLFQEDGTLGGPVAKNLSETEQKGLMAHVGAAPGDAAFFAAGETSSSRGLLAAVRLEIGRRCGLIDDTRWEFGWIVDAPLFEPAGKATAAGDVAVGKGAWTAVHHAFTSPKPEWIDRFEGDPGSALASAYDIVCNGNEIGGGSIRIHRKDVQQRVFDLMGIGPAEAQEKFGFLLDAFSYGPPPHGGIAFGWDRVVMLLAGADSLRDVIAFPKTGAGFDPLTGAPTPITEEQRKEAGVDAVPEPPSA